MFRNSIHGSAICAFKLSDITKSFEGPFKEQKTPQSSWLQVPDSDTPQPHPAMVNTLASVPSNYTRSFILMRFNNYVTICNVAECKNERYIGHILWRKGYHISTWITQFHIVQIISWLNAFMAQPLVPRSDWVSFITVLFTHCLSQALHMLCFFRFCTSLPIWNVHVHGSRSSHGDWHHGYCVSQESEDVVNNGLCVCVSFVSMKLFSCRTKRWTSSKLIRWWINLLLQSVANQFWCTPASSMFTYW